MGNNGDTDLGWYRSTKWWTTRCLSQKSTIPSQNQLLTLGATTADCMQYNHPIYKCFNILSYHTPSTPGTYSQTKWWLPPLLSHSNRGWQGWPSWYLTSCKYHCYIVAHSGFCLARRACFHYTLTQYRSSASSIFYRYRYRKGRCVSITRILNLQLYAYFVKVSS